MMLFRRQPHPIEAEIPRLRRFARALVRERSLADDLVQDCLERALASWAQRRTEQSLRPWLFAILHNTWRSRMRRESGRPDRMPLELLEAEPMASGGQWERLELRDMDTALGLLPEEQRSILLLVALEGLGYEEVARIQDIPVGTVMSRLSRARERLRLLTEDRQPPSGSHLRRVK